MTEKQEEFEKFVRRTNGTWADKCLSRGPDGRYNVLQTWNDWIAWQACWDVRDRLPSKKAVDVIRDMLRGDDGQAWKEARKYLESIGEDKPQGAEESVAWEALKEMDQGELKMFIRNQMADRFGSVSSEGVDHVYSLMMGTVRALATRKEG